MIDAQLLPVKLLSTKNALIYAIPVFYPFSLDMICGLTSVGGISFLIFRSICNIQEKLFIQ